MALVSTCNEELLITNKNIETQIPNTIATVKSKTTVASIVTKNCVILVLIRFLKIDLISSHSFIRHAVMISTPAKADKGICDMNGPNTNIEISNAIAWFTAVVFAYITNKLFVFESKSWNVAEVWKEVVKFFGARIATGVVEIGGLPLLYYIGVKQSLFGVEGFVAKILVSVIVVILNYVFSKIFVFNKKDK